MANIVYAFCIGFLAESILCNAVHDTGKDLTIAVLMVFVLTALLVGNLNRRN